MLFGWRMGRSLCWGRWKKIVGAVPASDGGHSSSSVSTRLVILLASFVVASPWIVYRELFLTVVWPYWTCVRNWGCCRVSAACFLLFFSVFWFSFVFCFCLLGCFASWHLYY
ncbi:hypothetical protein ES288_A10G254500v1 [Gossypium darwinii]|uniref:Uncharacterized protein n=1 Tax=Gossypium darwinii TaxID=34276 RepID=A0A5D2F289_GOSDA|nr:hypothetical protein ES288_A10G254000v1 [Gossypium darwinii]TYH00188.1 hypothetical protein ES288_A10G254100v1 [Gossypium darwinii]TYH00189.1 hypothetical protein ES288_A10G254200v1 [Gossypium darwinii]TYH00192.1 hypothetical protein ES288_A10G254500v1 [Gossypium darwinii]